MAAAIRGRPRASCALLASRFRRHHLPNACYGTDITDAYRQAGVTWTYTYRNAGDGSRCPPPSLTRTIEWRGFRCWSSLGLRGIAPRPFPQLDRQACVASTTLSIFCWDQRPRPISARGGEDTRLCSWPWGNCMGETLLLLSSWGARGTGALSQKNAREISAKPNRGVLANADHQ